MVSILGGAGAGATVSIIIKAIDQYSKEFSKLNSDVQKQQTSFQKLGGFLKSTGLGYAALAGAGIAFAKQSVDSFIQTERAANAFNAVLGKTADIMLNDLRIASKGLVSDLGLMDAANKAMALGIDKNKLPELLEVAAARGKTTGRTVTEAFQDISIGIGRQSKLILDNLGIILDLEKAYADYALSIGKTSEQLTEMEKKTAVTNKVLEESQYILKLMERQEETTSEKLERLGAAYENTKSKVGEFIVNVYDSAVEIGKAGIAYDLWTSNVESPEMSAALDVQLEQWTDISDRIKNANEETDALRYQIIALTQGPFTDQLQLERDMAKTELDRAEIFAKRFGEENMSATQLNNLYTKRIEYINKEAELQFALDSQTRTTTKTALENLPKVVEQWKASKENVIGLNDEMKKFETNAKNAGDSAVSFFDRIKSLGSRFMESASGFAKYIPGTVGTIAKTISPNKKVGDAIIRPNGDVIETDPRDTLIATKNGMGGNITIEIGAIYGVDSEDISRALMQELGNKLSL